LDEVVRIKPTSSETIPRNISFPGMTSAPVVILFDTKTSRHAAHSSPDPRAVSKKWQRSGEVNFPLPSEMFNEMELEARSS